jgi:hypothetical protein
MLSYKSETIKGLQVEMRDLDPSRLEMLIAVIVCLLRDHIEDERQIAQVELPFRPHMRFGCWLNVYGRAAPVPAHARALVALVRSGGGLEKFSFDTARSLRV